MEKAKHFVLVHGMWHGAWCWYKIFALLKAAGQRVTALDLGACGVNIKQLNEVSTISDHVQPLMDFMSSLPQEEKVILVGHSYGGMAISLAMEAFPHKILVAVYVSGFMPNCRFPPANLVQEFFKRTPTESLLDTQFLFEDGENLPTSVLSGPKHLAANIYQNCQLEDIELGNVLVRPSGLFLKDLCKESLLTEENFGSVDRIFIGGEGDELIKKDFQLWFIENSPPKGVEFIAGGDHMIMLSKPKELFHCFMEIAQKY